MGQSEAVDCLVERIALIKAGLTDPTRPLGVFLFVGPTGTGKTELAKSLAEFLFGSPDRLVRLDMSEFQTADSLERLLGDPLEESEGAALISSVRSNPFSVVLLDEFEKAHRNIWSVFLQLFDDGRLTDRRGRRRTFGSASSSSPRTSVPRWSAACGSASAPRRAHGSGGRRSSGPSQRCSGPSSSTGSTGSSSFVRSSAIRSARCSSASSRRCSSVVGFADGRGRSSGTRQPSSSSPRKASAWSSAPAR